MPKFKQRKLDLQAWAENHLLVDINNSTEIDHMLDFILNTTRLRCPLTSDPDTIILHTKYLINNMIKSTK